MIAVVLPMPVSKKAVLTGKSISTTSLKVAALMKERRSQLGVSQEQVARYLEVSPLTVDLYETGKKEIPSSRIYGISNFLNIAPDLIAKLINKNE
jgi:transcriptional regulator with XRE-family HTH domain